MSKLQERLEIVTRKWWFFAIVVVIQFLPPVTSYRYDPSRTSEVIGNILGHAYAYGPGWRALYPVFDSLAILMLIGVFWVRNRWGRIFAAYAGVSYVIFAFIQNMADIPGQGHGIVTNNVVMFLCVALVWLLEAGAGRTDFQGMIFKPSRSWVIFPALMAFWYPLDWRTFMPDFRLSHLLFGPSGVTFCLMTPMFLAVLILCYPRSNVVTLRVTGIFGVIIAIYNLMFMVMQMDRLWWYGVLHLPLLLISLYGLVLGYRRQTAG